MDGDRNAEIRGPEDFGGGSGRRGCLLREFRSALAQQPWRAWGRGRSFTRWRVAWGRFAWRRTFRRGLSHRQIAWQWRRRLWRRSSKRVLGQPAKRRTGVKPRTGILLFRARISRFWFRSKLL